MSMIKGVANRTFMVVVAGETRGLPFECARSGSGDLSGHSFIVSGDNELVPGQFMVYIAFLCGAPSTGGT
jgi:hypothetical protein